jgi:Saxitoxin biosynthesis operon protein SxtJ
MPDHATHEDLRRRGAVKTSSNRAFGLVFATVFALIALWPLFARWLLDGAGGVRLWALALAAAFVVIALAAPRWLAPLNRLWTAFGLVLHRITNPLVMGLLFYGAVTPTGLIRRGLGKDPLRRKRDPAAASYWIERIPPGPAPESMERQF